ncbi:ATP-grasp domain-containing protein [Chlorobium sp. BLA1]|uniref:ATP-grasp domain-containing protein n=1 Tax=Candidatus Chlorobium masyuteum TaxID=2716876 RepID=UPI0014242C78|nr:ATP-grasp domain-containing protein [Candidatus Chlorobium masyuteum]NHQ59245.1 ATP-grasp domain-containing protein [Candidatus Chlorobium masyuteum]
MKTVLITGIGGDIAQAAATIIREARPDIRLIGVDMHEQHGGMLFVDEFIRIPAATSPDYLDSIRHIIASKAVDIMIPMSEPELGVTGPLLMELGENRCITAGTEVIQAGLDKFATINALTGFGLPVPWTFPSNQSVPSEYPCILKNRYGSGSRAVFRVHDMQEAQYLANKYPDAIFQEMLEPADREITCAVYRRRDGAVATLQMLRRLAGGFTGWAKVIKDEETASMCEVIAKGLNLRGSMNIQLRITDRGPRVFEINPRFSSTVLMRHLIGFSDLLWALEEAEGKSVNFPVFPENQIMVRIQGALIINNIVTGKKE